MDRRTYLTSAAALTVGSIAGCIGSVTDNASGGLRKRVSVSAVERTTPQSMENVDTDERPTNLEIGVAVGDDTITPDSTAQVTLTYTNEGSDTLELNINPERPTPICSDDENPGLTLVSDAYDPRRTSNSCWKPKRDAFAVPAVAYQYMIEPGQTTELPYEVWAAPEQNADCIVPRNYQFNPLYGSFTLTVTRVQST